MHSGENAFHITVTSSYTINLTYTSEILSIHGFESSLLVKGLDNPVLCFLSTSCNQVVVTNGTISYVLSILTGYCTYSEFIEAIDVEMVKVLPLISMTFDEDHALCNITSDELWYFDQASSDTTIDGFGWTPWLNLLPSTQTCASSDLLRLNSIRVDQVYPMLRMTKVLAVSVSRSGSFVEYEWQLHTTTSFFILKPQVTYTMTNADGS